MVATDLAEGDGSRAVTMELLDASLMGANLREAREALVVSFLRGALPPVDFRLIVRAILMLID